MSCCARTGALLIAAVLIGPGVEAARADVIAIGSAKDNTLYEDFQGSLSNGAGEHMFAGSTAGFSYRRALIAFDVAGAVPSGSTILSVSLTLHMSRSVVGDQTVSLHRLAQDWGEGGSNAPGEEGGGGPAAPGDATWRHTFYSDQFWNNLGGDFNPIASGATTVGVSSGYYTWASTPAMVADVQSWLDNPSASFGWAIIGNESANFTAKRFDTRENANEAFRPVLNVEYIPIPEPGAAALVLLGFGAARRRRQTLA